MLDDLLDVTRILNDRLHLSFETFDLVEWLRQVSADFEMAVHQPTGNQSRLALMLPDEPVPVRADPSRLTQVLTNLLDNAVKFSPTGKPIRIELGTDGDAARITVIDQGIGLLASDTDRIFRRHEQLAQSLSDSGPGMGLGLFLARQLVMAHGGEVTVFSPGAGQGSAFSLTLPRHLTDVGPPAARPA